MEIGIVLLFVVIVMCMMVCMNIFSHYHSHDDSSNIEVQGLYGKPVKSLFISTEVFSLHQATEVTDANEQVVYYSNSKFLSFVDDTTVFDAKGNEVSNITRKMFSFHGRHYIAMHDGTSFELSNELFHLIKDITNIEGLGWKITGNVLQLNFLLSDENDHPIAYVCQKAFSLHDKYSIDIYDVSKEKEIITIVIALQHMIRDRNASSNASSSSSAS
mgnify:FL=1